MPLVKPFSITKYNKEFVKDINLVVSPPYDVIKPEKRNIFASKSPYNIVHLTLPEGEGNEKYQNARKKLLSWLLKDVLSTDKEPGIFIYEQKFSFGGNNVKRRGILAVLKVEDYGNGIFRHEKTFDKVKEDRRKLMEVVRGHLEPIFFLYDDEQKIINNKIYDMEFDYTAQSVVDDEGVRHTVWKIPNKSLEDEILKVLSNSKIYIADGHHRYDTTLKYVNENNLIESDPDAYILGTFFNLYSKDVVILPSHRLIKTESFDQNSFTLQVAKYFNIAFISFEPNVSSFAISKLKSVMEERKLKNNLTVFGFYSMYDPKKIYLLSLKKDVRETLISELSKSIGREVASLDVTILNELVLRTILGLTDEKIVSHAYVDYIRNEMEAVEVVARGVRDLCFFLNPVSVDELIVVSKNDLIMPHKSTDFYPKIESGLSLYLFDEQ